MFLNILLVYIIDMKKFQIGEILSPMRDRLDTRGERGECNECFPEF